MRTGLLRAGLSALATLGLLLCPPLPAIARGPALAPGKVHALRSTKHDRPYSLFVPSKYSPKKSWPLVISSHGRGGAGDKEIRAWQGLANTHGFIVACPDMVTATNHLKPSSTLPPSQEDDEVLMSIVEAVGAQFKVNRRAVMITGFSGGGNPSYHSGLRHPDVFTHICTRGGNFAPQQIPGDEAVKAAGRSHLKIYIFFGDKDHVLIIGEQGNNGQAHAARDALKQAGYENVEFERVDGMGHESRPRKAADWFGAYLEAHRKLFKAGDQADALMEKARDAVAKEKYRDAVRDLLKCRTVEEKAGLRPRAQAQLDALDAQAQKRIEEASGRKESGDLKGAQKILSEVVRDFRGLPAEEAAKALQRAWKESATR